MIPFLWMRAGKKNIEGLAAEYALGTLDAGERASVAARRLREPQLDRAIIGWEGRLSPLVEVIKPVSPPGDLIEKIQARLSVGTQNNVNPICVKPSKQSQHASRRSLRSFHPLSLRPNYSRASRLA